MATVRSYEDDLTPPAWNITRVRGDEMWPTPTFRVYTRTGDTRTEWDIETIVAQVKRTRDHTAEVILELDCAYSGNEFIVGSTPVVLDFDPGVYFYDVQVNGQTVIRATFRLLTDTSELPE